MEDSKDKFDASPYGILVVDDHPQIRKAVRRVAESMGFTKIYESSNCLDSLKLLRSKSIDMVVLDLYLPDSSGFDVVESIRNRDADFAIPIIVVSGEASKEEIVKAADLGANDYLVKPFKVSELEKKMSTLLKSYCQPSDKLKYQRLAERLFHQRKYSEALAAIDEGLNADEKNQPLRHLKALTLHRQGKSEQSITILRENAELNSNYHRSYAVLANILIKLKKNDEAIEYMAKELELNPRQPKRQTQIAVLLMEKNEVEDAMVHLREALKENVKYRPALFAMAQAYKMQDNMDKAIYYYKRIRRYFPSNTASLEKMVQVCLENQEVQKAEYLLKDEKKANKQKIDTYIVMARLYLKTDQKEKVFEIIDEGLRQHVDQVDLLKLKAKAYAHYGEPIEAIKIYRGLIKRGSAQSLLPLSRLYIQIEKYGDAINYLHKSLSLVEGGVQESLHLLNICYENTRQNGKAYFLSRYLKQTSKYAQYGEKSEKDNSNQLKKRRVSHTKSVA